MIYRRDNIIFDDSEAKLISQSKFDDWSRFLSQEYSLSTIYEKEGHLIEVITREHEDFFSLDKRSDVLSIERVKLEIY